MFWNFYFKEILDFKCHFKTFFGPKLEEMCLKQPIKLSYLQEILYLMSTEMFWIST